MASQFKDKSHPHARGIAGSLIGWGWIMAYAVLLFVVAFLAISKPVVTGLAVGIMIGIYISIYGVMSLVAGFHSMSHRARWVEVLLGLLALAMGLYIVFHPIAGALSFVWMIGFWLLISGVVEVVMAFKSAVDRGWRLALGILDVVLGLILITSNPVTGIGFIATMVAISFFARGVFLGWLALKLRKLGAKAF